MLSLTPKALWNRSSQTFKVCIIYMKRMRHAILGDPGADSGDEEKSKRAEKYMARRKVKNGEKSLGTMSYQTSSKRSPPFWLLIGARKLVFFWHQSEARTAATVWNWSGKTLSPGALLAVLYFSSCHIFFRPFRLFLVPTICPWVSEDGVMQKLRNL